jgi:MFS family permease
VSPPAGIAVSVLAFPRQHRIAGLTAAVAAATPANPTDRGRRSEDPQPEPAGSSRAPWYLRVGGRPDAAVAPGARLRPVPPRRRRPIPQVSDRPATLGWFLFVTFLLNFGQGVYPPLLPELVGGLGLSLAAAGLLGTAFSLPRLILALPAGLLLDRLGPTVMMHAGMALTLAGTLVAATASSLTAMALARALAGLGYGTTAVVGIVYLMRLGAPHQRTRRGNMYEGALISANAVSGYLAGAVSGLAGWRWGFGAAAGAIGAGWLAAGWRVIPTVRTVLGERSAAAVTPAASSSPAGAGAVARPSPLALLAIYLVVFGLGFSWAGGIVTLAPLYGGQALGLSAAAIGRTLAIGYLAEAVLLIPVGWAADTFGRLRVLVPGLGLLLAGVVLLPFTGGPASYTVACALVIAGMAVWMVPASLLAEQLHGRFGGPAVGVYRFVADLGMVGSPALVGWLTGWQGFVAGAGAVAIVLVTAGGAAVLVLSRHRP